MAIQEGVNKLISTQTGTGYFANDPISYFAFSGALIGKATGVVAKGCRCGKALAATMRVNLGYQ